MLKPPPLRPITLGEFRERTAHLPPTLVVYFYDEYRYKPAEEIMMEVADEIVQVSNDADGIVWDFSGQGVFLQ
jgi:hypothetical protein